MAQKSSSSVEFKAPEFHDGLVLYFHPYNFYSQKVLLILHEKNIDFHSHVVDLSNGEQYSPWFLNLNPQGDVPVLQDGSLVIPGSQQIINYLEGKYKDKKPNLLPTNLKQTDRERLELYEQIINKLPVGAISLGSFIHEDLKLNPKPPFIGPVRQSCIKNNEKMHELLKSSVENNGNASSSLGRKIELQKRRKQLVGDREEFQRVLDAVQNVLTFLNTELKEIADDANREWLISTELCIADISLGLLLHRLYSLGFENHFWTNGRLPEIEKFFHRFKNRKTFEKLLPTNFDLLKDIWSKTPSNYKIGAGAGILGMAMIAAMTHK